MAEEVISTYHNRKADGRILNLELKRSGAGWRADLPAPPQTISLLGSREEEINVILSSASRDRYNSISRLRKEIVIYLNEVRVQEKPFKGVWDNSQHARQQRKTDSDLALNDTPLHMRHTLLATSLLLRCDVVILSAFLVLQGHLLEAVEFSKSRIDCQQLFIDAQARSQPLVQLEAQIFCILYCLAEWTYNKQNGNSGHLRNVARRQIADARQLLKENLTQTKQVAAELDAVEGMFKSSTFVLVVREDEETHLNATMTDEFDVMTRWYTCSNGHPFGGISNSIERGPPVELTHCPQCGALVGGQNHVIAGRVQPVTDDEELLIEL